MSTFGTAIPERGRSEIHSDDLDSYSKRELNLAFRNHGIHYEGLREDITPIGMHYLLIHFDIPKVDVQKHRLTIVDGSSSMELSMEDIKSRPKKSFAVTMECAGNGRVHMKPRVTVSQPWDYNGCGTAIWTGTPLKPFLEEFMAKNDCKKPVEILFGGKDKGIQHGEVQYYQRSLTFDECMNDDVLLAYEMNGQALPPQHGYPLRLIVPGFYGMTNVKWLDKIEFLDHKFNGVQMKSYVDKKSKTDVGIPVKDICVRSLFIPPGIPDWFNRYRFMEEGEVELEGRAWAGFHSVVKVEIGIDGVYHKADIIEDSYGKYSWKLFRFTWNATPGIHEISCRATDSAGNVQAEQDELWNYGGFKNNAIQKIKVVVKTAAEMEVGAKVDMTQEHELIESFEISRVPEMLLNED